MTPKVAEIEAMDRAALVAAWSDLFLGPAPKGLSQSFLRRFLAFEVQARRLGGCPKGFWLISTSRSVANQKFNIQVLSQAGDCCANGTG